MKFAHIEEIFEHKGYKCACVFNKMGYRCGYVAVDETHPWYKKDYSDDGPNAVACHWGLTYSDRGNHFYNDESFWWFGFDCGHCSDRVDYDTAKEYDLVNEQEYVLGKRYQDMMTFDDSTMKDIEFVKDNCKMIVEQLIIAEKERITT